MVLYQAGPQDLQFSPMGKREPKVDIYFPSIAAHFPGGTHRSYLTQGSLGETVELKHLGSDRKSGEGQSLQQPVLIFSEPHSCLQHHLNRDHNQWLCLSSELIQWPHQARNIGW